MKKILSQKFYERDTSLVAKELLGKELVFKKNSSILSGIIVETEAYYGQNDPASHAAKGATPRCEIMFGPPARAYIYLNYGIHYLLNVVTEKKGKAGAVLIRAVEPRTGIDIMKKNRNMEDYNKLTNGPGKLTQAMGINLDYNGCKLNRGYLTIWDIDYRDFSVKECSRIGINEGSEKKLRYFIVGNKLVSKT